MVRRSRCPVCLRLGEAVGSGEGAGGNATGHRLWDVEAGWPPLYCSLRRIGLRGPNCLPLRVHVMGTGVGPQNVSRLGASGGGRDVSDQTGGGWTEEEKTERKKWRLFIRM